MTRRTSKAWLKIVLETSETMFGEDFRDYLEGEPIHKGDQLQLEAGDRWLWVRYELASFKERQAMLVSSGGALVLDRAEMSFRWKVPEEHV